MKATRTRTLRGVLDITAGSTGKLQLLVDDGNINVGYKVNEFYVWSNAGTTSFLSYLSFAPQVLGAALMDSGNNSQFAWTWLGSGAGSSIERIIDPDHIAVRDLFLTIEQAGGAEPFNYMIEVEEYSISDDEAIINIIKEGSQSL
jgi:hypothetical protein